MPDHLTRKEKLVEWCEKFIHDHNISCAEVIHQTDKVIEDAYDFIEGICDILGYIDDEESD